MLGGDHEQLAAGGAGHERLGPGDQPVLAVAARLRRERRADQQRRAARAARARPGALVADERRGGRSSAGRRRPRDRSRSPPRRRERGERDPHVAVGQRFAGEHRGDGRALAITPPSSSGMPSIPRPSSAAWSSSSGGRLGRCVGVHRRRADGGGCEIANRPPRASYCSSSGVRSKRPRRRRASMARRAAVSLLAALNVRPAATGRAEAVLAGAVESALRRVARMRVRSSSSGPASRVIARSPQRPRSATLARARSSSRRRALAKRRGPAGEAARAIAASAKRKRGLAAAVALEAHAARGWSRPAEAHLHAERVGQLRLRSPPGSGPSSTCRARWRAGSRTPCRRARACGSGCDRPRPRRSDARGRPRASRSRARSPSRARVRATVAPPGLRRAALAGALAGRALAAQHRGVLAATRAPPPRATS